MILALISAYLVVALTGASILFVDLAPASPEPTDGTAIDAGLGVLL